MVGGRGGGADKGEIYFIYEYRIYLCIRVDACANSVDPDETPQNAASHQGVHCLHCLPLIQQFLDTTSGSIVLFQILEQVWWGDVVSEY